MHRPIIMWAYNQSGVTKLMIMRDPHYGRMCFKSVKTLGTLHSECRAPLALSNA